MRWTSRYSCTPTKYIWDPQCPTNPIGQWYHVCEDQKHPQFSVPFLNGIQRSAFWRHQTIDSIEGLVSGSIATHFCWGTSPRADQIFPSNAWCWFRSSRIKFIEVENRVSSYEYWFCVILRWHMMNERFFMTDRLQMDHLKIKKNDGLWNFSEQTNLYGI